MNISKENVLALSQKDPSQVFNKIMNIFCSLEINWKWEQTEAFACSEDTSIMLKDLQPFNAYTGPQDGLYQNEYTIVLGTWSPWQGKGIFPQWRKHLCQPVLIRKLRLVRKRGHAYLETDQIHLKFNHSELKNPRRELRHWSTDNSWNLFNKSFSGRMWWY